MVEVAYVRHLDGAELDRVEVLLVLGEHLAVADLDRELAAGAFLEDCSNLLDAFGVGAPLAPVGMPPFDGGTVDRLSERNGRGDRQGQCEAEPVKREAFHGILPCWQLDRARDGAWASCYEINGCTMRHETQWMSGVRSAPTQ